MFTPILCQRHPHAIIVSASFLHKLVWEMLDGGLKCKIEIQWSDIVVIMVNYLDVR